MKPENIDIPTDAPTFVSLYSGAGGLDLGFVKAGFAPIWANDFDSVAAATYASNLGDHIVAGPIEEQAWPAAGSADLVVGGPPCQGFSVAGHMDPSDPRSRHVSTFFDVVEHVNPRGFVMENVKNLAINERWHGLRESLKARAVSLGYDVRLIVVNASHFGVPQARERMFLLGFKGQTPDGPAPTTAENLPTVRATLESLPSFGSAGNDSKCVAKITPAKRPVLRKSPFAGMLFNGKGRALNPNAPAPTLPASMGGNRTPIVDQEQFENGGPCWIEGYHDHLISGGAPFSEIPKRLRRLTVQEAAALQTFPTDWNFCGSQSAQFRQIGNAVPPLLAFHVANSMLSLVSDEATGSPVLDALAAA